MDYRASYSQTSLTPWSRRWRYWLSRFGGRGLKKSQTVALVEINGQRFKRVQLRDSFLAGEIESALAAFGPTPYLPPLVIRYENEIWVDFIDGQVLQEPSEESATSLAEFYAHIYQRGAREIDSADSPWLERLDRDLSFLKRVGVVPASQYAGLASTSRSLSPSKHWLGFDYNDPVLKNFVRTDDGKLCGIDVEALVNEQLIGLGVAKALQRWMRDHRDAFFSAYLAHGGPDYTAYQDFSELCQLALYTKLMFVERKWANVNADSFKRFS